jgi:hypothetical protein
MGHLAKNPNIKSNIGQKIVSGVQTASTIAGTLKTAYEVGKGIYSVGKIVAPIIAGLI